MTSSVHNAATRSSATMPTPCIQPRARLKRRSVQPMGPGFTASKKRNSTKAMHCASAPAGMTSQSTIQKATISSQTMAPGSAAARSSAVRVQAQTPTTSEAPITAPQPAACSQRSKTRNATHAHNVPTVPGAHGDRPLPKPSAIQREGWRRMKVALARCGSARSIGVASVKLSAAMRVSS